MKGAVVYDKIVGRAAAMLLSYAKVKEVWTPTASMGAKQYFLEKRLKIQCYKEVKKIMNRGGNDMCPMEKMSAEMSENDFLKKMLG